MTTKAIIQCPADSPFKLRIIEQDIVKLPALAPVVYHSLGLKSEDVEALDVWQDRPQTSWHVLRPGETRKLELTESYRVILEWVKS